MSEDASILLVLVLRLGFRLVGLRAGGFSNLSASNAIRRSPALEWLGTEAEFQDKLVKHCSVDISSYCNSSL